MLKFTVDDGDFYIYI